MNFYNSSLIALVLCLIQTQVSARRLREKQTNVRNEENKTKNRKYFVVDDLSPNSKKHNVDLLFGEESRFWERTLQVISTSLEPAPLPDRCADVTCDNPIDGCDPFDGLCKPLDGLVPCVAIIDETDQSEAGLGDPAFVDQLWNNFRAQYPNRPFCLLQPLDTSVNTVSSAPLYRPEVFNNDPRTIFAQVSRDDQGVDSAIPGPSDWFEICRLSIYQQSDIRFVGKFLDVSGSMTLGTVQESNTIFETNVANAGLEVRNVFNDLEDWITPFVTTLVPSAT